MKTKKLSIIMPVYNEENTLKHIIDKVLGINWGLELELIIVNDCSKDRSAKILESYSKDKHVTVITNPKNIGKSQTVKRGIAASTGDLVAIQDSDLEYEPEDLLKIVDIFRTRAVDAVYGNRFGKNNKIIYYSNWIGNRALSLFSNLFTYARARMWTSDMETCYKVIKGEIFRDIAATITSTTNFGLEPEITAKLARYKVKDSKASRHIKFAQIPINYHPRTIAQGKKMKGVSDGFKALYEIIIYNIFNR